MSILVAAVGTEVAIGRGMHLQNLGDQEEFITKDGSRIRSILDSTNAPVQNHSLAEARLAPGASTRRHYHKVSEEIYFITSGQGEMELDGEVRKVGPGDGILIPPGAWHELKNTGSEDLALLCCCAPPYQHDDTYFE